MRKRRDLLLGLLFLCVLLVGIGCGYTFSSSNINENDYDEISLLNIPIEIVSIAEENNERSSSLISTSSKKIIAKKKEKSLREEVKDNDEKEETKIVEVKEKVTYNETLLKEKDIKVENQTLEEAQLVDEYTKETSEKRDNGVDDFIDSDNWSLKTDVDSHAGEVIPDSVVTEWERKDSYIPEEIDED